MSHRYRSSDAYSHHDRYLPPLSASSPQYGASRGSPSNGIPSAPSPSARHQLASFSRGSVGGGSSSTGYGTAADGASTSYGNPANSHIRGERAPHSAPSPSSYAAQSAYRSSYGHSHPSPSAAYHRPSPTSSAASPEHTPQSTGSGSLTRYQHASSSSSASSNSVFTKPQLPSSRLPTPQRMSYPSNPASGAMAGIQDKKRKPSEDGMPHGYPHGSHSGMAMTDTRSPSGHDDGDTSGDAASKANNSKRIKTARACDSCRRKKIRCDVIEDGGPILGDPNNGNNGLTCAHCRQYGFECTFFLPITETRFKKKREREAEEMAVAAAAAGRAHMGGASIMPPMMQSRSMPMGMMPYAMPPHQHFPTHKSPSLPIPFRAASTPSSQHKTAHLDAPPGRISSTQEWPRPDRSHGNSPASGGPRHGQQRSDGSPATWPRKEDLQQATAKASTPTDDLPPPADTRVLGPTSLAYIVHSTAFVPGAAIEEHDLKHHQTFEVGASGDGIIKFHKPPKGAMADAEENDEYGEELVKVPEHVRGRLAGDVAEKLVNTYFEKLGHLFPVVTKSEFLHMSAPPPLMLYAICGIAALSREVPKEVLSAIKMTVNGIFRESDVLSNSNMNNVKAMLIMSLHSDVHGPTAVSAGSRYWNRVGTAIRMAQDLGLHRDASRRDDLDDDAYFLEQKRRVWGCCVTADRCVSISLGHPLAIDLTDCDVRLPSPHEILRYPSDLPSVPGSERPFAFNTEMLKLSILFGRVMKTIYSPTGLMKTTDEEIVGLQSDIDRWQERLPAALQFTGPQESSAAAGILHVSFTCLLFLFFRVWMRISYNCPQHLTFSLTIERMTQLIKMSRESINWVDLNDFYLDTMQFVSYGLVFCTTVQYHAWIRRGDQEALASLKKARDCVMRFERQGETDAGQDLSMRSKTAGVIALLYDSAIGLYANKPNSGNLNPTAGVTNRRWVESVRGIVFKPDPTKPGGGVYIVTKHNLVLDDLPPGTMVLQETEAGAVPALVRTANGENNGGWQTVNTMADGSDPRAAAIAANAAASVNASAQAASIHSELTHVAGSVWADAEGRPVTRSGERLLTMIPVPGGGAMMQSFPGGGRFGAGTFIGGDGSQGGAGLTAMMSNGQLNPAWIDAMTAQATAAMQQSQNNANGTNGVGGAQVDAVPFTFNVSDLYTFDGQVAQPATSLLPQQLPNGEASGMAGGATGEGSFDGMAMANGNGSALDPLSLDGMPGGPLDFAAWEQWFRGASNVNLGGATGTSS